ncbi:MAG: divergent polysaccharide deacetylase family protein [Candidatus Cloacimonetes bacterium]|jgi:polysaccharide deacetylase 2 family uncharacterized protein YibQ|nr:divergent polysaccharide deacetylase family protein [Candidatus Cloacimonadota bacterium]
MGKKLTVIILFALLLFGISSCKKDRAQELNLDEQTQVGENEMVEPTPESMEGLMLELPLAKYEYNWGRGDQMPDVVIIIDDFGYTSGQLLEDFANLPPEIVFAVMPNLAQTKISAEKGAAKGHEIILHLPMEAQLSSTSPGERYISEDMSKDEIAPMIDSFLEQLPMAIGVNNHMGSTSTESISTMDAVLRHLKRRGLFFIDSVTTAKSVAYAVSKEYNLPFARRDIFLDVPDSSDETLAQKIQDLGKYKGRREPVIIITHCHNREKLDALHKFLAQIKGMGINIIPLRDVFGSSRV